MDEPNDPLNREVAIAAKLEENGVSLAAKSRAVAAFDRLFGALADIPAAYAEGVASKKRLKDQINERRIVLEAELAEAVRLGLPQIGGALALDAIREAARKQSNKASVVLDALEELKRLPPPPSPSPGDEAERPDASRPIDDDWMNQYVRFTEDASSDDLQEIWGRVLAGEISRPGSFSRHTLRFIAELDSETARNCQFAADRSVQSFIPKLDEWKGGHAFMVCVDLQRLGLIEGADALPPNQSVTIPEGGIATIENVDWGLVLQGCAGTVLTFPAMIMTRLGREVFSLLKPVDPSLGLRNVALLLRQAGVKTALLGRIRFTPTGQRVISHDEVLWDLLVGETGSK